MSERRALALFGTTQPVPPARRLVAGALSCELCEGQLRDLRWGDLEILRGVSYLLRDGDWGTVPATVGDLQVQQSAQAFDVRFELRMATAAGSLVGTASIHGQGDGRLSFEVRATPDAPLATNRCGFVLLHPASAAGLALQVEHTDGRTSATRFPRAISPSQPVLDIRALTYAPAEGVALQVRCEAELPHDRAGKFEMEDQRNWSDASFKTYVASLLDPWPYELPRGRELVQRIGVTVRGAPPSAPGPAIAERGVTFGAPGDARAPAIGVGVPPGLARAQPAEIAALRELGAGWWIAEADLRDTGLPADLARLADCRAGLPARVQLDVIAPEQATPEEAAVRAADLCRRAGLTVDAVRLLPAPYLKSFQPGGRWPDVAPLEAFAGAARRAFPGALLGGGMFTSFTELNRKRPDAQGLDFIGHLTCPIVHAADDASVLQTIECLPHIVASVRTIWPALAYRLGPTTIAPRRNPYGEATAPNPRRERIALAVVDPRHAARFGAAWTVAYAAAVAPLGLEVLALHDSHGASGPLMPAGDGDAARALVPAWSALQCLARASGGRLIRLDNLPPALAGIAWTHDGAQIEGVVANLTDEPARALFAKPVRIEGAAPTTDIALAAYEVCAFAVDSGAASR